MPGNSDPKTLHRGSTVGVDGLGSVSWGKAPSLGGELTPSRVEVVVVGRVVQGDPRDGVIADGHGHIAPLAGPVNVMLVGGQVLGQSSRVAHGGPHQAGPRQAFEEPVPEHLAVAEANLRKPRRDGVGRQEQGLGQFLGGIGHVAGDEAESEPKGGAISREDFAELEPGELAGGSPKPVEAVAAVEGSGKQLRGRMELSRKVRPDEMGVMPDPVVERARHGENDLLGVARPLQWDGFRSRSTSRVFGRVSISASFCVATRKMTRKPSSGDRVSQDLQSGSVRKIPVVSMNLEEAAAHFGWMRIFAGMDMPSSSALTQTRLGWHPTQKAGMIADLDHMDWGGARKFALDGKVAFDASPGASRHDSLGLPAEVSGT